MRVKWLVYAIADMAQVRAYIAQDNPHAAKAVGGRLMGAARALAVSPALGRPGRLVGTREMVVPDLPYILAYRVRNDAVEILRVLHTSRRWPSDT